MEQNLFLRTVERDEIISFLQGKEYIFIILRTLHGMDMKIPESTFILILILKWYLV